MRVVRDAIADKLLASSYVSTRLGVFKGTPAVFSMSPIPPAATGRLIVVRDAHIDVEFPTKTPDPAPADYAPTRGRDVAHDVAIYQDQTGDSSVLEDLALYVRDYFNRQPLTVSGYGVLIARAQGPIEAPGSEEDADYVDGRLVTVMLTLIKDPT